MGTYFSSLPMGTQRHWPANFIPDFLKSDNWGSLRRDLGWGSVWEQVEKRGSVAVRYLHTWTSATPSQRPSPGHVVPTSVTAWRPHSMPRSLVHSGSQVGRKAAAALPTLPTAGSPRGRSADVWLAWGSRVARRQTNVEFRCGSCYSWAFWPELLCTRPLVCPGTEPRVQRDDPLAGGFLGTKSFISVGSWTIPNPLPWAG